MPRNYASTKSIAVVFNGITFRRYPSAKQWSHRVYYTPHAGHRRNGVGALHQEIWKQHYGEIPQGCIIHHRNENPFDNSIGNLECVTKTEHNQRHKKGRADRAQTSIGKSSLDKARAAAAVWHKSPEGIEWHKKHGKASWSKRQKQSATCALCGKEFFTFIPERAKFCGWRCRQRQYANEGRYTEQQRAYNKRRPKRAKP